MDWTDEDMEALRRSSLVYYTGAIPPADIVQRAAAEITRLREKVAELEGDMRALQHGLKDPADAMPWSPRATAALRAPWCSESWDHARRGMAADHIEALEAKLAAPPWETLNVLDGDIDRLRARMALAASELRNAQESWRLVADALVSADNPAGLLRGCAHRIDGIAARLEQGDENEGEENDHI